MKKLLLLSAFFIFACSSDDSSDTNDNNNNELLNCDGNPVPTIVYGTQEWTVENACHITYRDGTPIPQVTNIAEWKYLTTGAWCFYENDPNKGVLYNWYAVKGIHDNDDSTPNKEFAPTGWHVPSDEEWTTLEEYLVANGYNYDETIPGGYDTLSKAIASTTGWNSSAINGSPGNNQNLNNLSGFNALPSGYLNHFVDLCGLMGDGAFFWTTSLYPTPPGAAWARQIMYESIGIANPRFEYEWGLSVRLVKD